MDFECDPRLDVGPAFFNRTWDLTHYHVCPLCGLVYSHVKRHIPPGKSWEAHTCLCGQYMNERQDYLPVWVPIDHVSYYGCNTPGFSKGSGTMIRSVAVGATAVRVASAAPNRISISFAVGNTANSSSVMLRSGTLPASATEGLPLAFSGGLIKIDGIDAHNEWSAIRLAAVDCVLGVIEEFPVSLAKEPTSGEEI